MTGRRLSRRTLACVAAMVLLALTGLTMPATAIAATVTAATGPGEEAKPPTKDPKPCHGRDCPTDTPAAPPPTTGSPVSNPQPSDPATTDMTPADPGQNPAAPPPSGQQVGGAPPGASPRPGSTGQRGGGPVPVGGGTATDDGAGAPARPAAATTPVDRSLPLWPILWGGTALIALVTAGLLVALRDRRKGTDGGRQEPEQGVASPSGPIRMQWTEPPG